MPISETQAQVAIAREYAEALVGVVRRALARFPAEAGRTLTQPLTQYAEILTEKLGVGLPDAVYGCDQLALSEALHALQHLGCYLERATQVKTLSPTRHALILELHQVTVREVTLLLRSRVSGS